MTSAWPIRNLPRTFLPRVSEDESLCFTGQDVVSMALGAAGTMFPKCRESPFQKKQVMPTNRKAEMREMEAGGGGRGIRERGPLRLIKYILFKSDSRCP